MLTKIKQWLGLTPAYESPAQQVMGPSMYLAFLERACAQYPDKCSPGQVDRARAREATFQRCITDCVGKRDCQMLCAVK